MKTSYNPETAAEQARKTYRDLAAQPGLLGLDPAIPEGVRDLAEKTVANTSKACDRSMGRRPIGENKSMH